MGELGKKLRADVRAHARNGATVVALSRTPPVSVQPMLDRLLSRADAFRDVVVLLLAKKLDDRKVDITRRFEGDRAASNDLGEALNELHIPCVDSAVQNSTFRQGFLPPRPSARNADQTAVTRWAQDAATSATEIRAAYHYLLAKILATARDVPPFPRLVPTRLIHRSVCEFIDRMTAVGSGGGVEQYLTYGLLRA
jgi:hypothetical protein